MPLSGIHDFNELKPGFPLRIAAGMTFCECINVAHSLSRDNWLIIHERNSSGKNELGWCTGDKVGVEMGHGPGEDFRAGGSYKLWRRMLT
jgi:hypothetical protein